MVITHEMFVVKEICDRVAVMDSGRIVEKGDIVPIFIHPVEEMTKNFIATASNSNKIDEFIKAKHPLTQLNSNQQLARLQYDQNNTAEAMISHISRMFDVDCSIIFGNVEILQDAPIGTLTVIFTGQDDRIRKSIDYLRQSGVEVEVIKRGHID